MIKKCALLLLISFSLNAKDIILWDLHGVIFTRSLSDTLKALTSCNMIRGISQLDWAQFKEFFALVLDNILHEKSGEDYIQITQKQDHDPALTNAIIALANAQKIMPGMQSVIEDIDQLGIEQHIGSNIGRTAFNHMLEMPQFASIFAYMNLKKSQVVESNRIPIIKKPNPLFFQEYLQKNKLNPAKTRIIFIDDRKDNVDVANQMGLVAIHFRNPTQLRQDLIKLGIHIPAPSQKQVHFEGYKHLFA
jgi:beta-phosphoglucomutase-like phosphatase (HAD superfamily)